MIRILTPEDPAQLSAELRLGRSRELANRRAIIALTLLAGASTAVVALYQSGVIRHLPEPRSPSRRLPFDADRVDAVPDSYAMLATPDAFLGLVSYAATATLAAMGGADRARRRPWLPLALAGKLALDCGVAGWLTWFQAARIRAFCSWCLLSTAVTFAALPFAVPEARSALATLRRRRGGRR